MSAIKNFFKKLSGKTKKRNAVIKDVRSERAADGDGVNALSDVEKENVTVENSAGESILLPAKTATATENENAENTLLSACGEEFSPAENLPVKAEKAEERNKPEKTKASKKKDVKGKSTITDDVTELALLLNEDEGKVRDDCLFSGIKKFTEKLGKVIVRYDVSGDELLRLAINSQTLGLKETAVSPAYIPAVARAVKRSKENVTVSSLIDFPFGENAFSAKLAGVKESVLAGVDEVSVFMPAISLYKENKKQLGKDLKKIAKAYKKHAGVAFSAENLSEENILIAARAAERAGLNHVLFAFGESDEDDIRRKLSAVMKSGTALTLKVLGNVKTAGGASKLFKMGAELVLTPFADEIGDELLKRFGIKSVKLI